jgi:hypothetical protein
MLTVCVSPSHGNDSSSGATEKLQLTPPCETVTVVPPMLNVPTRGDGAVFAAMFTDTDPSPVPDDALGNVIHDGGPDALHAHTPGDPIAMVAVPPLAPTEVLTGVTE